MIKISRNPKRVVILLLCAVVFLSGTMRAQASTYYVAKTGNDSSLGSLSQPFQTIRHSISVLQEGDTLYIRAGTYSEAINSNVQTIPTGTSWSTPVTITGYPGETVILKPVACQVLNLAKPYIQYIVFKDMILDGANLGKIPTNSCVVISLNPGTHHLRFINLEVKNSPWSGIMGGGSFHEFINLKVHDNGVYVQSLNESGANGAYLTPDNSMIIGGEWYNNQCYGIRFFDSASSNSSDNNVIKNAKIYRNGRGVAFSGASNCSSGGGGIVLGDNNNAAYNNVIYDNYWGLTTSMKNCSGIFVYNNTFYKNLYGISISSASVGAQVRNNILFQNGSQITNEGAGTVLLPNLCSSSGPGCSLTGDPKFVNPTEYDFHLQDISPAIDTGTQLSNVKDDLAGIPRPQRMQYDIGAYEALGTYNPAPGTDNTPPSAPQGLRVF